MFTNISHFLIIVCLVVVFLSLFVQNILISSFVLIYRIFCLQFIFVSLIIWVLGINLLLSDFSLALSFELSHSFQPFLYKLSSFWSNNEGSFFLWSFLLIFINYFSGFLRYKIDFNLINKFVVIVSIKLQALLTILTMILLLFSSNPFLILRFLAYEGCELNPVLQDFNLVIHPPLVYIGYILFIPVFSGMSSLVFCKNDHKSHVISEILNFVKFFNLLGCLFLTVGILLGSRWAYYELGWGGFWYWDAVENISLLPWFLSVSFLHGVLISKYFNQFYKGVLLNSIILYPVSILGTFLVRSGLLQSVHSFAEDKISVFNLIFFLLLLVIFISVSYFTRYRTYQSLYKVSCNSSQILILYIVFLFFIFLSFFIFIVTFVPLLLLFFTGKEVIFGASFYNSFFLSLLPFFSILFLLHSQQLVNVYYVILGFLIIYLYLNFWNYTLPFLYYFNVISILCLLVFWFYISFLKRKFYVYAYSISAKYAHFGLFLGMLSVLLAAIYSMEIIKFLVPNNFLFFNNFFIILREINQIISDNYLSNYADFLVYDCNLFTYLGEIYPEKRFYFNQGILSIKTIIQTNIFCDLYILFGEGFYKEGWYTRIILLPFIPWFWLGGIILCLGVLFSIIISFREQFIN